MKRSCQLLVLLASVTALAACGIADLSDQDPKAIVDAPTYAVQIRPIMQYYCAGCHAPKTQLGPNLRGFDYSSYSGVLGGFSGIEETVFQLGSMPPGSATKVTLVEQAVLTRWQDNGFAP